MSLSLPPPSVVLDSSAMIAFIAGEPGKEVIAGMLADEGTSCYAHAANLVEVWYDTFRRVGDVAANTALDDAKRNGVVFRQDMDEAYWRDVAWLKAKGRVALADCFGLALARRLDAKFLTSDRGELQRFKNLGLARIVFFR